VTGPLDGPLDRFEMRMGMLKAWSGWRSYRKLPEGWRNIVIYAESGQDWHYFEPLVEALNVVLHKRVTYVTSDATDPGLARQHDLFKTVCIPAGFFLTLHFNMQKADIVVLTMMDLNNLQLRKSINPVHYIYLFHALGSTHMVDHANSYDAYDSLFCAGPHHVTELRKREFMAGLPARNLFEYGHPRLENLLARARLQQREGKRNDPPVVLIAPTWGNDSIFNTCGDELTGVLLDAGYHVIARPHYQTLALTPEVMSQLRAEYGEHANFEYQDRMGESDTLLRSDILICDWSAMAIEYALALEKPVLFVDLPRRVRNPEWQALGIEPLEDSFRKLAGEIVSPEELVSIPQVISRLLETRAERRRVMQALRPQMVFNVGNSTLLGAVEIKRLAEDKALTREQQVV